MNEMKIEAWDIEKITPYELNSKIHDPAQVAKIAKSIKELGWDQPIVVDANGVVIKGHGRRLAAISLGMTKVPVLVRRDLTPEQVRAARLADNRVALSGIDTDLLQKELADLDFDLDGIFDAKELSFLDSDITDLGTMNVEAFVPDIDIEVRKQAEEGAAAVEKADAKPIKIEKVLGFKSLPGKDERPVARFMALIEAETGLTGADAFVAFARNYQGAAA